MTSTSRIPASIRAICFDAVGTLIFPDPHAPLVYAAVGQRYGSRLDATTIRSRFLQAFSVEEQHDLTHDLRTSEEREVQRWRRIVATVLDDTTDPAACFHDLYTHFSRPAAWRCGEQVGEVLPQLATRFPLTLASNYDQRLRSVAAGLPELRPISHLLISSEIGWRKPAPAFFAAVCQTLALSPEQILFIGDDPVNDYAGANAAGLEALLFAPGKQAAPEMQQIKNLRELL